MKDRCAGQSYQGRIGWMQCGNRGTIGEAGNKWCGIHAPSKVKVKQSKARVRSDWRSEAWDFNSKIRHAESEVMAAAQNVYKSQIGAGWEMEQQRIAVQRLVRAYGELESVRSDARAHDAKRPSGIRKV